jgi:DNA-binding transcriptional LysR family regulator
MSLGYGLRDDTAGNGPMRLRHLEVFNTVMLAGTASAAGRLLRISQPAVTKLLAQAEAEAGLRLFERDRGRLVPTAEAQALFAQTRKAFAAMDDVRRLARNLRDSQAGRIRVAAIPALSLGVLPRAVQRFLRMLPGTGCEVATHHTHEMIQNLLHHELDVGFVFNAPPHEAIQAVPLAQARMVAVATDPALPEPLSLRNLDGRPFIALDPADPLGELLQGAARRAGLEPRVAVRVQTYHTALMMARSGVGIAIIDRYTALALGQGSVVRELDPPITFTLHALTARSRQAGHLVDRFVACLKAAEREIARPAG